VGGKNVEIQPRAGVCKILEIADADDVEHPQLPCGKGLVARHHGPATRRPATFTTVATVGLSWLHAKGTHAPLFHRDK
jgi:hypothetical protein